MWFLLLLITLNIHTQKKSHKTVDFSTFEEIFGCDLRTQDTSGVLNLGKWESVSRILNYHEAAECAVSNMLLYQLEADGLS